MAMEVMAHPSPPMEPSVEASWSSFHFSSPWNSWGTGISTRWKKYSPPDGAIFRFQVQLKSGSSIPNSSSAMTSAAERRMRSLRDFITNQERTNFMAADTGYWFPDTG